MCLFLDSASEADWVKWLPTGLFTGVTTNPIILVGQCRLKPVAPCAESAWIQRLKLKCAEPLSSFAFKFSLRLYVLERDGRECNLAALTELAKQALDYEAVQEFQVQTWGATSDEMAGRCSLTLVVMCRLQLKANLESSRLVCQLEELKPGAFITG